MNDESLGWCACSKVSVSHFKSHLLSEALLGQLQSQRVDRDLSAAVLRARFWLDSLPFVAFHMF